LTRIGLGNLLCQPALPRPAPLLDNLLAELNTPLTAIVTGRQALTLVSEDDASQQQQQ
jgi:hypothetical protein